MQFQRKNTRAALRLGLAAALAISFSSQAQAHDEERNLYWGDTHLHTSNSFDAFGRGNYTADPETAYRYAKGLPVIHPYHRARIRIDQKLDFLVIADHAEFLGVMRSVAENGIPTDGLSPEEIKRSETVTASIKDGASGTGMNRDIAVISAGLADLYDGPPLQAVKTTHLKPDAIPNSAMIAKTVWGEATALADKYNEPGEFTTFIGWEWSPIPGGANLHRVIFTDAKAKTAQTFRPFDMGDSPYPEDVWKWLEEVTDQTGAEFIAIPHNSNISKGFMFPETTIKGEPVTLDYARLRAKWEPVAEVTQIKGDSETIGELSPDDPFADFETYSYYIQPKPEKYVPTEGDYARGGLKRGLELEKKLGVNPYKFGMIGSTDAHTSMASAEEQNFHGKMPTDSVPERKAIHARNPEATSGWAMSAQGLAAVWAENNDRSSIMAAFKRREVYATSGPRIKLRFFGGWDFEADDITRNDYADIGYDKGVPMGGDLLSEGGEKSPSFLVHAVADPRGANLDRVQIVKGWLDGDGVSREKVYNVSWAGERKLNRKGRLPHIGSTVNLEDATFTNTIGSEELFTVWEDPDFDKNQNSFYYIRVLEIPTPRHALADAIALEMDAPDRGPKTLQERAYSSPIWYTP